VIEIRTQTHLEEFHREGAVLYKEEADMAEGKPSRRVSHFLLPPNRHSQWTVVADKVWYQPQQWRCDVLETSKKMLQNAYMFYLCICRLNLNIGTNTKLNIHHTHYHNSQKQNGIRRRV